MALVNDNVPLLWNNSHSGLSVPVASPGEEEEDPIECRDSITNRQTNQRSPIR